MKKIFFSHAHSLITCNRKFALVFTLSFAFLGCKSESNQAPPPEEPPLIEHPIDREPIREIVIEEELYPHNFRAQLHNNLQYFQDGIGVDENSLLPYDFIRIDNGDISYQRPVVNSTTLGLYLNILTEMERSGSIQARLRLLDVVEKIEQAPKWNGLFYWMYPISDDGELEINENSAIASAVDAANLTSSLAAVAGAYWHHPDPRLAELSRRTDTLIKATIEGWEALYDRDNNSRNLLRAGWRHDAGDGNPGYSRSWIDRKSNESRLAPLWAHLLTMNSNNPIPQEVFTNMSTFVAKYQTKEGTTINPMLTWNGTYFQGMLPSIWFDELLLVPDKHLFEDMATVQLEYTKQYQIPFLSSSSTIDSKYDEYGIEAMSEDFHRFGRSDQDTVGTPHASALYAMVNKEHAVELLLNIEQHHPNIVSAAGWFDAVDAQGNITNKIIGLDQGMFTISFFSKRVRQDVENYIHQSLGKSAWNSVIQMYTHFVKDGFCTLEQGCPPPVDLN